MDNKEEILAGIIDRKFESRLEMVLLKKGIKPAILDEVIEESIFDDEEEYFYVFAINHNAENHPVHIIAYEIEEGKVKSHVCCKKIKEDKLTVIDYAFSLKEARKIAAALQDINSKKSLYQILCKLFNFHIPSQIYLKQASSF